MKKNLLLPALLIALIAILIVFEPSYGWRIRNLFIRGSAAGQDTASLALQNQALQADLAKLQVVRSQIPEKPPQYLRAMVYSRYPLNFKNELLVDIGRNQGVAPNAAAVFQGVLIGKVEKAYDDTALIETVFDSRFQLPVRIGSSGIDALLTGGSLPKATLIPLKASVNAGDIIYSASPDLPYGLPIGAIGEVKMSPDQLFRETAVTFAYDISAVETVVVAKAP